MFVFELPEIGEGVIEGEVVRWLVQEGQNVSKDEPLCEIMTDKATIEISSPRSGRVVRLHGVEGDVIKVHQPLVDIDEGASGDNGATTAPTPPPTADAAPAPAPEPATTAPKTAPIPSEAPAPTPAPVSTAPPVAATPPRPGKTLASPAVRTHARQAGIDINQVHGSGKSGRVTHADLDAHGQHPSAIQAPPAIQVPSGLQDKAIKIIGLRRKIAEKMVEAYRTVPHFTYVDEVDMTELVSMRASLKPLATDRGIRLTYLPFIMKALCVAFREFPTLNAVMDEEAFTLNLRGTVNIGIATDTEGGLVVPVIKGVEQKSVLEIAADIAELTDRTRAGRASLDELQGGSFTVTSVGNIGGRFATPIINHPEVAILGVNQIHDRAMVVDGEICVRKVMYLSPSFDHRVIDGAVAARFVARLKSILENPGHLLAELR